MANFEKPAEPENEVAITNEMQMRLAVRLFGFDSGDAVMKWIDKYSPDFRKLIKTHPEYVREYQNDPEGIITLVEEALYEKESA